MLYTKQILVRKTVKRKLITAFQKQNLKQDTQTIKYLLATKNTKLIHNYRINSGQLNLQRKNQL